MLAFMMRIMIVVGACVASGCVGEEESWSSSEDTLQIQACHGRVTDGVDSFTLSAVSRSGDDLLVNVKTGGGCKPHRFAVCWDGYARTSYPAQIDLELTHDANDPCRALLSFQLRIDTSFFPPAARPLLVRIVGQREEEGEPGANVTLLD